MSTPERSTATRALVIAGATVLGGLAAYALYFDYKRRNDAQFRKQLRKEHKRVKRAKTETAAAAAAASALSDEELKAALLALREEPMPTSTQERELYFTQNISEGERLSMQGPSVHMESALYFYRALRVYPQPVELIMIYQKTVPEPVFNILMKLTTLDVSPDAQGAGGGPGTNIPIIYEDDIDDGPRSARSGPPSETSSSVDWDKVVDTGTNSPTSVSPPS